MNNQKDLIVNLFNDKFNLQGFIDFTQEIFKGKAKYGRSLEFSPKVKGEFNSVVKSFLNFGRYTDNNRKSMILAVVELKREDSITRSRTIQRNFVKDYFLKNGADSALVAFYNKESEDWRLSFIKLDYSYKNSKLEEDITPAKRFSFLLGKNEKHHTAVERFMSLILQDKEAPTINKIEEVFNIEVVTKEFFEKYCELYLKIKKELDKQDGFSLVAEKADIRADEFAKKLMGQLVFLYFLQKKGWLGVEINPENISVDEIENLLRNKSYYSSKVFNKVYYLKNKKYYRNDKIITELNKDEIISLNSIFINTKYDKDWGTGDKFFIRSLFKKAESSNKNFFKQYLEPIFYNALNYSRENDYFKDLNCKIPFLNGGLFQPISENYDYKNDNFTLYNSLFSNNNKNKQGDVGDGILDIFDRYAFTIKEDEPLEKEVAVDPEMLGKVFENLLDVTDRKKKGAFYTPREIVHYMCQECLINYLVTEIKITYDEAEALIRYGDILMDADKSNNSKASGNYKMPSKVRNQAKLIDNALENVKIADPAVGSGAFPLGMVNEIVRARANLTYYILDESAVFNSNIEVKERTAYELKKRTIRRCIHAVDIERSAVDITKLRLWLSLVIEENDFRNVTPLPNLDYNIMVGNSLIEEFEGIKLFNKNILNKESMLKEKKERLEQLSLLTGIQKSEDLLEVIYQIEKRIENVTDKIEAYNLKKQLEEVKKSYNETAASIDVRKESDYILEEIYELQERFFEVNDTKEKVIIKKRIDTLEWLLIEKTIRENGKEELLPRIIEFKRTNSKPYFLWKLNFARVFKEKNGFDIFIGNPPYIKERDNKDVFKDINNSYFGKKYHDGKMDLWYYFLHRAIDFTNDGGVISYITPRYWLNSKGATKLIKRVKEELQFKSVVDIGDLKVFENVVGYHMIATYKRKLSVENSSFVYKKLENNLEDINCHNNTVNLKYKILNNDDIFKDNGQIIFEPLDNYKNTIPLGNLYDVSQGVVEAIDKISKKSIEKFPSNNIVLGEGVFVVEEDIKNNMVNKVNNDLFKKYLNGQDISRYNINCDNIRYLIYSNKNYKSFIANDSNYEKVKLHLDKYQKYITSSNKPYGIHRPRDSKFFDSPKLIVKNMFKKPEFVYDEDKNYVGMSCSTIINKNDGIGLKYLLGILNSNFALYWFYKNGKRRGIGVDIGVEKLREFPLRIGTKDEIDNLIIAVNNIIRAYSLNDFIKIATLEKNINDLVYKIYKLEESEIEEIESFSSSI